MRLNRDGIQYAQSASMIELLSRLGVALGISLVLTLLLLVLYQDDGTQAQDQPADIAITQTTVANTHGTP